MPPVSSRSGRRIASKACDICRLRKTQCIFDKDDASCRRCTDKKLDCTFLTDRRQRGPAARRAVLAVSLPVGKLSVDHLCSPDSFRSIIDDYLQLVFPLLPLVHRPSFLKDIEASAYAINPAFFRLCIAICAVTVASLPRKFDEYGQDKYPNVGAMVDRACHMVLLSRISSEPEWQNKASKETMIVSILLTMASHYAGRPDQGWIYASEAIQFFRALVLYRTESYERLSLLEGQICKRAFWILYIIQIHDRLSFIVPHTGLSFEPLRTHWEFLLPLEIDDENLQAANPYAYQPSSSPGHRPLPVISGFIALIKVFLCVADLLSNGFPGSPPQAFAMTSGTLRESMYPDKPSDMTLTGSETTPAKSTVTLSALLRIVEELQTVLRELPLELSIPTINPHIQSTFGHLYSLPVVEQFDIMRANIHVTSLYLRSTILETCSSAFTGPQADVIIGSPGEASQSNPLRRPQMQLWAFRKSIARELLDVLKFCSTRTLEASGSSMIVKIREIAATLLNNDDRVEVTSEEERQTRHYLARFAEVLTTLDYMGQAIVIPPD